MSLLSTGPNHLNLALTPHLIHLCYSQKEPQHLHPCLLHLCLPGTTVSTPASITPFTTVFYTWHICSSSLLSCCLPPKVLDHIVDLFYIPDLRMYNVYLVNWVIRFDVCRQLLSFAAFCSHLEKLSVFSRYPISFRANMSVWWWFVFVCLE